MGADLKKILILGPMLGGVNSVPGEKLHELKTIYPPSSPHFLVYRPDPLVLIAMWNEWIRVSHPINTQVT